MWQDVIKLTYWTKGVPSRSVCTIKGGEGQSNTTVVMLNIQCDNRATCFDSMESSTSPRVIDQYKECTTHCGIPNAYNNRNKV